MCAEELEVGMIGFVSVPIFKQCLVARQGRVWGAIFDVNSSLSGKRPEEVAEIGINEHCSGHACDGKVGVFSDTILWGGSEEWLFRT